MKHLEKKWEKHFSGIKTQTVKMKGRKIKQKE